MYQISTNMNKQFLVVLLAVCLVSAQAFVKRDAPAAPRNDNYIETLQKQFQDFSQSFNDKVKEAFDPDTVKKNFNEFIDNMNKAMESFKPKQPAN